MNEDQLWRSLTGVFRAVFDRDDITIAPETTADDIDEWDSLNHLQLIVAIEKEFAIRFKSAEVAGFQNVGDLVKALRRHKGI